MNTYMDKNGNTFVRINNFWALDRKMRKEFGTNWKNKCIRTYGKEQLFENQYNSRGRLC